MFKATTDTKKAISLIYNSASNFGLKKLLLEQLETGTVYLAICFECIFAPQKLLWREHNIAEGTTDIFHCSQKFNEQEITYLS